MSKLFFSYSHADEALRDQLEKQLSMLKRQGVIETWHDRRIVAGSLLNHDISEHVEQDDIILLLVSSDFLDSDYCYDREMTRAMERQEHGEAIVIPVILRACDWHHAPFGKLMATPTDGRPITQWPDRDEAFLDVAKAIRKAAERVNAKTTPPVKPRQSTNSHPPEPVSAMRFVSGSVPRSSNLRLAKNFTERDKDAFRLETFEYLAKFFENSLAELGNRRGGVEGAFRRIDGNRFTAVIYQHGKAVARCTVFMGGSHFDSGIAYVAQETSDSNSYNESLRVDTDDQSLFLRSMGMAFMRQNREEKLSQEGAAELYWGMLIEPLQRT